MAKSTQRPNKKTRRELAKRRARTKKLAIISTIVVIVIAVAAYVTISLYMAAGTETFTDGYQIVRLRPNGRFTATLYHNVRHSGRFTMEEQEGLVTVAFTHDGVTVRGQVTGDNLIVPDEWRDACGHSTVLARS
jgi:hypothetical protein